MAALATFGLKQSDGTWKNFTIALNDETDKYGSNVQIYESQTKEERLAKKKKVYFANGKIIWNDGIVKNAVKVEREEQSHSAPPPVKPEPVDDLPF
jgi:hypothetical protein